MTIQGVAQPAIRMGKHAAKISAEDASADPRTAFRYYDKGDVAAIGRYLAAADVRWPFQARLSSRPGMSRVASDSFAPSGWLIDIPVVIAGCWPHREKRKGANVYRR
jgi:NADH dehydrogenase FAD-containing subunit